MTETERASRLIPGTPEEWLSYVAAIDPAETGRDKIVCATRQRCQPYPIRWVLVALVAMRLVKHLGRSPERVNIQECLPFKIGSALLKDMIAAGVLIECPPPPGSGRKRYAVAIPAQGAVTAIAARIAEMIGRLRDRMGKCQLTSVPQ